jgi:hypothetical protein
MSEFIDYPVNKSLAENGLDEYGQSPLSFYGAEQNRKTATMNESGVPSNFIQDGETIVRLNVTEGWLQSNGFVAGSNGWQIKDNGNVEFNDGVFRGALSGATGTFTGALSGATGTFTGALSGATGTFTGGISILSGGNVVILLEP